MTRQERRLVETLVGQRTIWVDGVAVGVGGMEKPPVAAAVARSMARVKLANKEAGGKGKGAGESRVRG